MLHEPEFAEFFARTVQALEPYLADIVCGGGCANALYRHHESASDVPWEYIGTVDIDMIVGQTMEVRENVPLAQLLVAANLEPKTRGQDEEPVVKFVPRDMDIAADLEFLCPLSGLKGARDKDPVSHRVQVGLSAQPLRYLELALSHPWSVALDWVPGFSELHGLKVQVPNPAAYVVQKILIRDQNRRPAAMDKDCYYIYEVSVVFRDSLDLLREEYERLSPFAPKWKSRFEKEARGLFESEAEEGPRVALAVYEDSASGSSVARYPLTREMIYRSVEKMLDAMNA